MPGGRVRIAVGREIAQDFLGERSLERLAVGVLPAMKKLLCFLNKFVQAGLPPSCLPPICLATDAIAGAASTIC
jgi:hypothetical protein